MTGPTEQTKQPSSPPGRGCDGGPETGGGWSGGAGRVSGTRATSGQRGVGGGVSMAVTDSRKDTDFPAGSPGLGLELAFPVTAAMPWDPPGTGDREQGSQRVPWAHRQEKWKPADPAPWGLRPPHPEGGVSHPESSSVCALSSRESLLCNCSLIRKNVFYALSRVDVMFYKNRIKRYGNEGKTQ